MIRFEKTKREFELKLEKEFPFMVQKEVTDEQWEKGGYSSYDAYGCCVDEGWYDVLRGLCLDITKAYEKANKPVDVVVSQVKEKFGALRFYCHPEGNDPGIHAIDFIGSGGGLRVTPGESDLHREVSAIVRKWEDVSASVCEKCGADGEKRTDLGWIKTLCDSCYKGVKEAPPPVLFAEDEQEEEKERREFTLTAEDVAAMSASGEFVIPDGIKYIERDAFKNCTSLTSVKVPKTVENISWGAFSDSGIKNIIVDLQNRAYSSVDGVLYSKYLTELHAYPPGNEAESYEVPDEVRKIWHYAFRGAHNLKSITITNNNVRFIGNRAFEGCSNLSEITIPNVFLNGNNGMFNKCPSLKYIDVSPVDENNFGTRDLQSIDGVFFKGPQTFVQYRKDGEEIKRIEHALMKYPEAKPEVSYEVPPGITRIDEYAFADQLHLKSITLPTSVTEIGEGAFDGCHKDLLLRCSKNSYAHEYAVTNKIGFELISEE